MAKVYIKHFLNKIKNKEGRSPIEREITYNIFIAFYIHHKFVVIHPFVDGNGRMARLLMCLVLRYNGLSFLSYPALVNKIINEDKNKYLDVLNQADKGNYIVAVNYML